MLVRSSTESLLHRWHAPFRRLHRPPAIPPAVDRLHRPPAIPPAVDQLQSHWFNSSPADLEELNAKLIAEAEQQPKMFELGVEKVRELRETTYTYAPPDRVADVSLPGLAGEPDVGARIFFSSAPEPRGALLHIHGGGFVFGSAKGQNDTRLLRHADNCAMNVVSVEYRLSPEHAHPAALHDCLAAARWLSSPAGRTAASIGTDAPLLLCGESAGGYLAARLLLQLPPAERLEVFRAAVLTYGWFDLGETPYFRAFGEKRLVETADELRWFRSLYLGRDDVPPEKLRSPEFSPLYADLAAMPPCLFSVGTEDALLEDSLFMYARWLSSGNRATLRVYPGAAHGMGHFGPHANTAQGEGVLCALEEWYSEHLT